MPPGVLRPAFRFAMLIVLLAIFMLPFQPSTSAAFVVTVLSAAVGLLALGALALAARLSGSGLPPVGDKPHEKRWNGRAPTNGEGRD